MRCPSEATLNALGRSGTAAIPSRVDSLGLPPEMPRFRNISDRRRLMAFQEGRQPARTRRIFVLEEGMGKKKTAAYGGGFYCM